MKSVKEIKLVFENTDSIKLDPRFFGEFEITNTRREVCRISNNCIATRNIAYRVKFELFREANQKHYQLGLESEETTLFDRIASGYDITSIEITHEDGTTEIYYTDYDDVDGINYNQHSYISKTGDLFVVIMSGVKLFDLFIKSECNSKKHQDELRKSILGWCADTDN